MVVIAENVHCAFVQHIQETGKPVFKPRICEPGQDCVGSVVLGLDLRYNKEIEILH